MASEAMNEWVARVLGVATDAGGAAAAPKGMAGWKAARTTALASLKSLETAIRGFDDPELDQAIILLRAVQANLTAEPATPAQVAELERYLTTDDVITDAEAPNGFDITVDLRGPLLAALAGVRDEQATGNAP